MGLALITGAIFLPAAAGIGFDFSVDKLFLSDSPEIETYRRSAQVFPLADKNVMVVVKKNQGDWFDRDGLLAFAELQDRLEAIPVRPEDRPLTEEAACRDLSNWQAGRTEALHSFSSIRSLQLVEGEGEDAILKRAWPPQGLPEDPGRFRSRLLKDRLARGKLVSADGSTLLIRAQLSCGLHGNKERAHYLASIRSQCDQWSEGQKDIQLVQTGLPFVQNEVIGSLKHDFVLMQPLTIIVMLLLLYLAFGSLRAALMPFIATLFGCIWCIGLMGLVGEDINVVNFAITVVILVIGAGDGIHIVARYQEELEQHPDPWQAMKRTLKPMGLACALTTLTTLIGFLSLHLAKVQMIKSFGLWAAIGVGVTWIFTMVLIPALLLLIGAGPPRRSGIGRWLEDRWLPSLGAWVLHHRRRIIAASLALLLGASVTASQLKPFSKALEELPDDHAARAALSLMESELTGILPFEIIVEGSREQVLAPATLAEIAAIQSELEAREPGVSTLAITDLISALHSHWSRGEQGPRTDLPKRPDQLAALLATLKMADDSATLLDPILYDPDAPRGRASEGKEIAGEAEIGGFDEEEDFFAEAETATDGQTAVATRATLRITGVKHDSGSEQWQKAVPWLRQRLKSLPDGLTARVGGSATIVNQAIGFIVSDMMKSLLFAFILITILMGLLMRSVRVGLAAMVPNVMPLALTMAIMVIASINLRISTVITFAMCMGIVVDDSIHFLVRWREEMARSESEEEGMIRTIRYAGRPVIFTTTMLAAGFAVLMASTFRGLHDFGLLAVITISLALVSDLLTLPALLAAPKKVRT